MNELEELLLGLGCPVGRDQAVRLYHATNPAAASEIISTGVLIADVDGCIFVSTDPSVAAAGEFGAFNQDVPLPPDVIVPVRVFLLDLTTWTEWEGDSETPDRLDFTISIPRRQAAYRPLRVGLTAFRDTIPPPSAPAHLAHEPAPRAGY